MAARKIVLVTGGNNGIGYETVKAFLQSDKPYRVLLGSRSLEKAKLATETLQQECPETTNTFETAQVDLASDGSIEKAFEQVKASPGHIDVLVNNAGATFDIEFLRGTVSLRESFTKSYDVNVAGTNVLTWTFMPLLFKSADPRLVFVIGLSSMKKVYDGPYLPTPPMPAGWPKKLDFETIGYRCIKVALNMMMLDWNHKLKADGVKVWAVGLGCWRQILGI
ncbi:hypothetical protein LTR85_011258 [Meristemomyces frigidus]|nr:hypothetical protein LTR85_011258 [Meristemomyces frigidus]